MRRWLVWFLVLAGLALAGAGCSERGESEVQTEEPLPVEAVELRARDLPVVVEAVGRLAANREVTLAAEVGGVIAGYRADVGDAVRAGSVLVEIDPVDYGLALREAEANLAAAEARLYAAGQTYERSQKLLPRQVISPETFEKTEAEFKAARAEVARARAGVDIARERLAKTRITAPFGGLVAARLVEVGQAVGAGQPVMSLVDLDPVRVKLFLSELDYVDLDESDPVRVKVEAFPGREFPGRIDRIGIKADAQTNTFGVEVLVDNPELALKAGLTARVRLTTRVISGAILVPQSAVLYREDREEVFVLGPENTAQPRRVELGRTNGGLIQVSGGLAPGERLIVTGQHYLKAGDKVRLAAPPEK